MKKMLALLLGLTFSVTLLSGCAKQQASSQAVSNKTTSSKSKKTIRFGILPADSNVPIVVAKEKGYFDKEGVDVQLVSYNSSSDRNAAMKDGKLDGMAADVMTALTFQDAGTSVKITSDVNENYRLETSPSAGIDNFTKLKDKKISVVPNSELEYIMDKMAEKNNVKYKTVTLPSVSARDQDLLAFKISGALYDEAHAITMESKGAKLLASSKEYGLKAGAILFNDSAIKDNGDGIEAFYKAYDKAVDYINNTDISQYDKALTKYSFSDEAQGYLKSGIKYEIASKITDDSFNSILQWTKSKKMIKKDYTFDGVSDFHFID